MTDRLTAHRRRVALVPIGIALGTALIVGALTWGPDVAHHRDQQWVPQPWNLTVDDFPAGEAEVIPVREEWVEPPLAFDPHAPRTAVPYRVPGLELITSDALGGHWCMDAWTYSLDTGQAGLSGIRVGDLEIFTTAWRPNEDKSPYQFDGALATNLKHPYAPGRVDLDTPQTALLCQGPRLENATPLGDRIVPDLDTLRGDAAPQVEIQGNHGWVGIAGRPTSGAGAGSQRVAAAAALVHGHRVLFGLTAPADADVDWEAEIGALVETLEPKMAPPGVAA